MVGTARSMRGRESFPTEVVAAGRDCQHRIKKCHSQPPLRSSCGTEEHKNESFWRKPESKVGAHVGLSISVQSHVVRRLISIQEISDLTL